MMAKKKWYIPFNQLIILKLTLKILFISTLQQTKRLLTWCISLQRKMLNQEMKQNFKWFIKLEFMKSHFENFFFFKVCTYVIIKQIYLIL